MGHDSDALTLADLELLHQALAYMNRRVFDQAESIRLRGVVERLEELLLEPEARRHALRLAPPEQEVLVRQVKTYIEEITRPGGSLEGRREAARLPRRPPRCRSCRAP